MLLVSAPDGGLHSPVGMGIADMSGSFMVDKVLSILDKSMLLMSILDKSNLLISND